MITSKQVHEFKESFCNENKIIPNFLRNDFGTLIKDPILDVGSGLGDVSGFAFEDMEVVHLDLEDYSFYSIPKKHIRIVGNFFDYQSNLKIKTILLSHVLQFIDDDIEKLNVKIKNIDPEHIIIVRNTNDDFMNNLMMWFNDQKIDSNPEKILATFPVGYKELKKVAFIADLKCPDFKVLAEQVSYLWDVKLSLEHLESLENFLKDSLPIPFFQIHQEIVLFGKDL